MRMKWWWVTTIVVMVLSVVLATTRANAAPTVAIDLGSESLILGTTIDDVAADSDVLIDDDSLLLVRGASILQGEREMIRGASERIYQWDGADSAESLNTVGLGGWDATNNGLVNRFDIAVGAGRSAPLSLTVYDERGGSATVTAAPANGRVVFPFADLRGVDLTRVGAIELRVPNSVELVRVTTQSDLRATRTATLVQDANGDGVLSTGDTIAYTLSFTNDGNTSMSTARWQTTVQGRNQALVGTVAAEGITARSERIGNGNLIEADLTGLAAGATATLRYDVRLQGGAVPVTVELEEGVVLPEGVVGVLNSPFTNGDGEDGFVATISGTDRLVWFDDGIIWQNSDAAPTNTLTGSEGTMGIGNNGEFIYSPTDDGDDSVWTHQGPLLVDGDPAPNFPAPALNTFDSRPHMLPNGTSVWVAGTDTTGGTSTNQRSLYSDADGAPGGIVSLLTTGDIYDGIPIDDPSGVGFDYQQSDNGSNLIINLLLNTGSTANDDSVGVNGNIVAQEGGATGGGDNWQALDNVSINNSGAYLFSGDTNGATTSDEFIAYGTTNTPTLVIREGQTLDGITLAGASVNTLSINNTNQAAFIWTYTGGETLFVACDAGNLAGAQAILSVGDEIARNGGGGGFIADFNASSTIGPGLWLAEDGFVYVEVDLAPPIPFMGGNTEAVISLETGCATGGTPTPTNTTVVSTATPTATATNTTVPATNTPTATPGTGNRVCSNQVVTIPDNLPAGVTSSVTVATAGNISDMNVVLTGTHSWVGDLTFNLSNGTTNVTFYDRPGVPASTFGCSGDNLPGVVADDEGAAGSLENSCQNATPAYTPGGHYTPNNPLTAFDGQAAAGTWTLTASDGAGGDTGTLDGWCVEFETGGGGPTATPTNPPTVPDINVTPASFEETHSSPPQTTNAVMNIQNVGTGTLNWTIAEDDTASDWVPGPLVPGANSVETVADGAAPASTGDAAPLNQAPYVPGVNGGVLYDNGPLVNVPGGGAGGADASRLQDASLLLSTYGFGHALSTGFRVADDFTIPAGESWTINTVTFYAYQTGSPTTSSINHVNVRIWDGPPGVGSIVFGDTTTNRLASSTWSNAYRDLESAPGDSSRPVMASTVTISTTLPAGTYWIDWQTGGTLASGPWAPPVTITGTAVTGNAVQFDPNTTTWNAAIDAGAAAQQGFPFVLEGTGGGGGGACSAPTDIPWLTVSPTNGSTAGGGSTPVTLTFNSATLAQGTYTGTLCVESNDPDEELVTVPVTLNVGPPTAIDLSTFTAPVSGINPADLAAAGLLLLAGALLIFRRK